MGLSQWPGAAQAPVGSRGAAAGGGLGSKGLEKILRFYVLKIVFECSSLVNKAQSVDVSGILLLDYVVTINCYIRQRYRI